MVILYNYTSTTENDETEQILEKANSCGEANAFLTKHVAVEGQLKATFCVEVIDFVKFREAMGETLDKLSFDSYLMVRACAGVSSFFLRNAGTPTRVSEITRKFPARFLQGLSPQAKAVAERESGCYCAGSEQFFFDMTRCVLDARYDPETAPLDEVVEMKQLDALDELITSSVGRTGRLSSMVLVTQSACTSPAALGQVIPHIRRSLISASRGWCRQDWGYSVDLAQFFCGADSLESRYAALEALLKTSLGSMIILDFRKMQGTEFDLSDRRFTMLLKKYMRSVAILLLMNDRQIQASIALSAAFGDGLFNLDLNVEPVGTAKDSSAHFAATYASASPEELLQNSVNSDSCVSNTELVDIISCGASGNRISASMEFSRLIGAEPLKELLDKISNRKQLRRTNPQINVPHIFSVTGSSGSGKTYGVSVLARVLCEKGYLKNSANPVVFVHNSDLIGAYQGQTTDKTKRIFESAKGSCIIIEDMAALIPEKDYGLQAINEIMSQIERCTSDTFVFILGTREELQRIYEIVPRLREYVEEVKLADFTLEKTVKIIDGNLRRLLPVSEGCGNLQSMIRGCVENVLREITGSASADCSLIANGHFVRYYLDELMNLYAAEDLAEDKAVSGRRLGAMCRRAAEVYVEKYRRGELPITFKAAFNTTADVRWEEVVGNSEAKRTLEKVVSFIKTPEKFKSVGAEFPKGTLLVGPPGTGKTQLARAVATNAGVPFLALSGSDLVGRYMGEGAAKVREVFEEARKRTKCIIFIDELDAIGRRRDIVTEEAGKTLNQLLIEMDGFNKYSGIHIIAATNHYELLDPALVRSGRFDSVVKVDTPTQTERAEMFRLYLDKASGEVSAKVSDEELSHLADMTLGAAGADIRGIVNDALIEIAADESADVVQTLIDSISRKLVGTPVSLMMGAEERTRVAYHEAGHTVLALKLYGEDSVHKVTIVPSSNGSLGYAWHRANENRLETRAELENDIVVALGGMMAERILYRAPEDDGITAVGAESTGISADIASAIATARKIVRIFGIRENDRIYRLCSAGNADVTEREEAEVNRILDVCTERAKALLTTPDAENLSRLEGCGLLCAIAEKLLEKETLLAADIARLTSKAA